MFKVSGIGYQVMGKNRRGVLPQDFMGVFFYIQEDIEIVSDFRQQRSKEWSSVIIVDSPSRILTSAPSINVKLTSDQ